MIPNTVFTFFFMPLPPFFPRECTRPDAENRPVGFYIIDTSFYVVKKRNGPPQRGIPSGGGSYPTSCRTSCGSACGSMIPVRTSLLMFSVISPIERVPSGRYQTNIQLIIPNTRKLMIFGSCLLYTSD